MHTRALVVLALLAVVGGLTATAPRPAAAAVGTTLYVDGKTGNDANDGRSRASAFRTIAKAASTIPKGSAPGWTVVVKGYTDYAYRERPIPTDFASWGSAAAHIQFVADGYVPGSTASYVKPVVSGAERAPLGWQTWSPSGTPGVWKTPWPTEPFWFGTQTGTIKTAIYQDYTTWLWEQTNLAALGARATEGKGGYWWDRNAKVLYVSAVGNPATGGTDPAAHKIDVPVRAAFYFKGTQGVKYVDVRGFEVRHSGNGIAFDLGTDYSTAADNKLLGNFTMGLQSAGTQTPSGPDFAIGNIFGRNYGYLNTLELIKIDEGNQSTTVCDNVAGKNGLRGIFVQGRPPGSGFAGSTTNVTLCRNRTYAHDFNPTGTPYNNAAGITVANGASNVTLDSNVSYANDIGVHVVQEAAGMTPLTGIVLRKNALHDNRRFGLNLYDGVHGQGGGSLSSTKDVFWKNGTGIMVGYGSTNKTITSATIHASVADAIRVGVSGKPLASATITKSILTSNGGYGIWLVTGHSASLTYSATHGNALGGIKGSPSVSANNTQPPGYLSTTPGNANHLRISNASFQYTAGPSNSPIGARY